MNGPRWERRRGRGWSMPSWYWDLRDWRRQEQRIQRLNAEAWKSERHVKHYRSCGCLGDSDRCCDPSCCHPAEVTA